MTYRYYYGRRRLTGMKSGLRSNAFKRRKKRFGRTNLSVPIRNFALNCLKGGSVVLAGWFLFSLVELGLEMVDQSQVFKIREVRASGFKNLKEEEILNRVAPSLGRNLVSLDLTQLEKGFLHEPWVERVSLHKAFPDRLLVHVVERHPVAVVSDSRGAVIVDKKGFVLDAWSGVEEVPSQWQSLPVVLGMKVAEVRAGEKKILETFSDLYEIIQTAPFSGEPHLTLSVDPSGEFRVQRRDYWLRLGNGGFKDKWERFKRIESRLREWDRPVQEVDLRFPGKVIVR